MIRSLTIERTVIACIPTDQTRWRWSASRFAFACSAGIENALDFTDVQCTAEELGLIDQAWIRGRWTTEFSSADDERMAGRVIDS